MPASRPEASDLYCYSTSTNIVAFDNAGNKAVNNNSGSYFNYNVPAPSLPTTTSTWLVYGVLGGVLAGVAVAALKMLRKRNQASAPTHYSAR